MRSKNDSKSRARHCIIALLSSFSFIDHACRGINQLFPAKMQGLFVDTKLISEINIDTDNKIVFYYYFFFFCNII